MQTKSYSPFPKKMIFLNNHRDRANGGYATYKWFMKLAHEYFKFYKENEKVQFT